MKLKMKNVLLIVLSLGLASFSVSAQIAESAEDISPLLIGESIPEATLKAPDASSHKTSEILAEKPTVLLIYRGGWCPFCNAHLSEIQSIQSEVLELGYQIVAVSPDSPENLAATDEKDQLDYSLYSDADGKFIQSLGIAFKAPERYSGMLLKKSDGLNDGFLPVPSLFIVDPAGEIQFEYINPNYKVRLTSGMLLAILKELNASK